MKREPTQDEREKIVRAIATGDRIGATSTYISITECGLTEAQKARIGESGEIYKEATKETSDSILGFLMSYRRRRGRAARRRDGRVLVSHRMVAVKNSKTRFAFRRRLPERHPPLEAFRREHLASGGWRQASSRPHL
jgi:hypothetical protein